PPGVAGLFALAATARGPRTPPASMLGRGAVATVSFRRLGGGALALEDLGATKPSLRHPAPGRPARGVARELGHSLAVGGVPEKFLGWIHHRPVLLMIRLRGTSPRGETLPHIGKAAASTGPVHATSSAPSRRPIAPRNERIRSLAADTHPGDPWRFALTCAPRPNVHSWTYAQRQSAGKVPRRRARRAS